MQKLACIDWGRLSTKVAFVTLTLNEDNVADFRENFRRFRRRLHQRVSRGTAPSWAKCYVWKFEYGETGGRPHFHLLFPMYDGKQRIRDVLAPIWGMGFVWAETVSPKRVLRYLSKYVGKGLATGRGGAKSSSLVPVASPSSLDLGAYRTHLKRIAGRFWGVSGREYLQATLRACSSYVLDVLQPAISNVLEGFMRFFRPGLPRFRGFSFCVISDREDLHLFYSELSGFFSVFALAGGGVSDYDGG